MSITGHRSSHGIRSYKEISHEQEAQLSDLIRPPKILKHEDVKEEVQSEENVQPGVTHLSLVLKTVP